MSSNRISNPVIPSMLNSFSSVFLSLNPQMVRFLLIFLKDVSCQIRTSRRRFKKIFETGRQYVKCGRGVPGVGGAE